jgi:hypothetical protein
MNQIIVKHLPCQTTGQNETNTRHKFVNRAITPLHHFVLVSIPKILSNVSSFGQRGGPDGPDNLFHIWAPIIINFQNILSSRLQCVPE